jgi:hypothetical protein
MLRSATGWRVALAVVTTSLALAGCGGSSHPTAPASSAPDPTTRVSNAPTTDPTRVPAQCLASNGSDPAEFTICLAKHGVHLPSGGKLVTCAQSASTKAQLEQCLVEAAR